VSKASGREDTHVSRERLSHPQEELQSDVMPPFPHLSTGSIFISQLVEKLM
jgi:hypothetical protein